MSDPPFRSSTNPSISKAPVAAVASLAFVVRVASVLFAPWETNDSEWYLQTARSLAFKHIFSLDGFNPTAFRPPLYSTLIAICWFGESPPVRTVLLLQSLMGASTAALVYVIARRHATERVALLAALGIALAPLSVRFTAVILTETLFTFLVTLGVFWWGRNRSALSGLAFGFATLTRVTLLPFLVLLPLLTLTRKWRRERRSYLTLALLALAVCSIWIVRNAVQFHRIIPVAASGYGTNLLIGTMPLAQADDVARRKAILYGVDTVAGPATSDESEFDRARFRAALRRIVDRPSAWIAARIQQYPRLFIDNGSYIFGSEAMPFAQAVWERRTIQVLTRSLLIAANVAVFLFALIAVAKRRSQFAALSELVLFPLYLMVVALPLWIEPRYGLPMMPLVAIVSAMGFFDLWDSAREKLS